MTIFALSLTVSVKFPLKIAILQNINLFVPFICFSVLLFDFTSEGYEGPNETNIL